MKGCSDQDRPPKIGTLEVCAGEIRALVSAAAAEVGASGPSDRGKVMKVLMPRLRGRADGSVAAAVVGEVLDAMTSA